MSETLSLIAELSIGLAGFSGIFLQHAGFVDSDVVSAYAEAILIGGLVHVLLVGAMSFMRIVHSILKSRSGTS